MTRNSPSFETPNKLRSPWIEALIFFLLGLLVRIVFIYLHPAIYGGDALARIMHADRVLLAYQLPLLQFLIYLVNLISTDPFLIRYLMSLVGALAGAAFYLLSMVVLDRQAARLATLFFIFNPFLLVHSIVPYQEILMLLTLCLGLYFLLRSDPPGRDSSREGFKRDEPSRNLLLGSLSNDRVRRIGWASVFLGLACLTRYEAWVITAVAGLHYTKPQANTNSQRSFSALARMTFLFSWAPLLWILLNRGLSPLGTYVLEEPANWARLWRIPYITAMTLYHAGPIVCLLAVSGLLVFWKQSLVKNRRLQMLIVAAVLLLLSLVFSAHGVQPDPQRYVTDREAHWFLLFAFWAAALGFANPRLRLRGQPAPSASPSTPSRNPRIALYYLVLILAVLWGVVQTDRYIRRLLSDQNLVLDSAVAEYLAKHLPDGTKALIFAEPLSPEATKEYLDKVYSQGGLEALQAARQQLTEMNAGSVEFSRIVVNARLRKDRFLDGSTVTTESLDSRGFLSRNHVRLVVIFSNYPFQNMNTLDLLKSIEQQGKHQVTLADRGLQASIYEVPF